MKLTAIIYKEDEMYVAECPEIGTASQGVSIERALDNLKEATELYLEEFPIKTEKQIFVTSMEVSSIVS